MVFTKVIKVWILDYILTGYWSSSVQRCCKQEEAQRGTGSKTRNHHKLFEVHRPQVSEESSFILNEEKVSHWDFKSIQATFHWPILKKGHINKKDFMFLGTPCPIFWIIYQNIYGCTGMDWCFWKITRHRSSLFATYYLWLLWTPPTCL